MTEAKSRPPSASPRIAYLRRRSIRKKEQKEKKAEERKERKHIIYASPRLEVEDEQLFPVGTPSWQDASKRWERMSDMAGQHSQDGSVLRVGPRHAPEALKGGMTASAAARVKILYVPVMPKQAEKMHIWLDVIATTFFHLEHLHLSSSPETQNNPLPATPGKKGAESAASPATSEQARNVLRRLYILYRLPDLLSIDGKAVTDRERSLARPDHPNGTPVSRNEWIETSLIQDSQDTVQVMVAAGKTKAASPARRLLAKLSVADSDAQPVSSSASATSEMMDVTPADSSNDLLPSSSMQADHGVEQSLGSSSLLDSALQSQEESQLAEPPRPVRILSPKGEKRLECMGPIEVAPIEYVDSDSTTGCEWTCGGLSYLRGRGPLHMAFGSRREPSASTPSLIDSLATKSSSAMSEYHPTSSVLTGPMELPVVPHPKSSDSADASEGLDLMYSASSSVDSLQPRLTVSSEDAPGGNSEPAPVVPQEPPHRPPHLQLDTLQPLEPSLTEEPPQRARSLQLESLETTTIDELSPLGGEGEVPLGLNWDLRSFSPRTKASLNQRIPPSKSLTSPFPMQFRQRVSAQSPPRELSVTTKFNSEDEASHRAPPPPPHAPSSPSIRKLKETIEAPLPLLRVQSSPSKLTNRRSPRPPPSPSTGRRLDSRSGSPNRAVPPKRNSLIHQWRAKVMARSSSILDDDDEEEEEEEEERNSDEENASVPNGLSVD